MSTVCEALADAVWADVMQGPGTYSPLMDASDLELGSVFRFPAPNATEPNRVLFVDDHVVMYDAWWPHLASWGMADLAYVRRGTWNYYATLVSTVLDKAVYVRKEPMSPTEVMLHRPDLPFAIGQNGAGSWSSDPTTATPEAPNGHGTDVVIAVAQVYLTPFGPNGGTKSPVAVDADNGSAFTVDELMRKAAAIQTPHIKDERPTSGVGLYRAGLKRGIPSYYLWGAVSRLHHDAREYFDRLRHS
jgi:hypothetical protein